MTPNLNRRMQLQHSVRVPDGAGGFALDWQALGWLWVAVEPGSGRDGTSVAVAMSELPLQIILRGAPVGAASRPVAGQRLVEGTRRYRILAVAEADAAGRYLTCFAREEAAR